ncbi:hypothetical protein F8M49_06360 [Rhodococcus zopfii]|uniref:Uncharacterized protein n=1 Tax=Rhodococcus zopfii TaxID=43772 RepID=A0ABU3WMG9_9NOCA|nr:hypothetical protein [Rhodococcus zopfii]
MEDTGFAEALASLPADQPITRKFLEDSNQALAEVLESGGSLVDALLQVAVNAGRAIAYVERRVADLEEVVKLADGR